MPKGAALSDRFGPIGIRFGLSLIILTFLLASFGSGMDRMGAAPPAWAKLAPASFQAQAQRKETIAALTRGNADVALEQAADAVRSDPVAPLSSALLGSARLSAGDISGAQSAFRVAGQLGWRDRLTQLYWFEMAIRSGDLDGAALRIDAILRSDPKFGGMDALLSALEKSEAGQQALARRMSSWPIWISSYFSVDRKQDDQLAYHRAQVALAAAEQGLTLGCDIPRSLVETLLVRGARGDAEMVWQAHCSDAVLKSTIIDGGFEQLAASVGERGKASPFGWHRHNVGDVAISFGRSEDGGHTLNAQNNGSVSRRLVTQATALSPGSYLLRADVTFSDTQSAPHVVVSLDCGGRSQRLGQISGDLSAEGQLLEIGPCDHQRLTLWLRPGSATAVIDNIRIQPAD